MPTKRLKKFEAWSYSRLEDWEGCPFYAYLKHLEKRDTGPGGPALVEGSKIHREAEGFVRGAIKKLPESLVTFKEEFAVLRKDNKRVRTELQLGLNRRWEQTGWFGDDTWLRIVIDALHEAGAKLWRIIDYKTGKNVNPQHKDQLSLYALGVFALAPKGVTSTSTELWYTKPGEMVEQTFKRDQVAALQRRWESRSEPMLCDTTFRATPGGKCRWCPFCKAKGGQCKY